MSERNNNYPPDDLNRNRDRSVEEIPEDPDADLRREYTDEDLPQHEKDEQHYLEQQKNKKKKIDERKSIKERAGSLKNNAVSSTKKKLIEKTPGAKKAQEVKEKVEKSKETVSFVKSLGEDVKNIGKAFQTAVTVMLDPHFWIGVGLFIIVAIVVITMIAYGQVYGKTKSSTTSGFVSGAMQQRLAQRAEWLQENVQNYPDTGSLTSNAVSPKGVLGNNPWEAACPQIVQIIYGLSPYLTSYMGSVNAYSNYKDHPDMYQAWAFSSGSGPYGEYGDGSSSEGASLQNPPAGAIVSLENSPQWYNTCCPGAGHTFVMLTDKLAIDNWSGGGVNPGSPGIGPRIVGDVMRSHIVAWVLPKDDGFEGSFITGSFEGMAPEAPDQPPMNNLPPVPTWVGNESDDNTKKDNQFQSPGTPTVDIPK